MSDYNSEFTGDRVVELLNMIPNLAKADLSNATTVSLGQNGYAKFNNGFLIQWGKKTSGTSTGTIYFPISFHDANYSITMSCNNGNPSNDSSWIANWTIISYSHFGYNNKYQQAANAGANTAMFQWIAVGRWK